jgi:hypothetical protein
MPKYKLTIDLATNQITHFTTDLTQSPQTENHLVQAIFEGELPPTMTLLNCTEFKYIDRLIVFGDTDLAVVAPSLDEQYPSSTTLINFAVFNKPTGSLVRLDQCTAASLAAKANLTGDEDMLIMTNPDGSALSAFNRTHQSYLNFETGEYFQIGSPPTPEHRYDHLGRTWVLSNTI